MKGTGNPQIIVYTGDGKGKTCAAMGQMFRCLGHGGSCAVIQFLKSEESSLQSGEKVMALKDGVTWKNYGAGFSWEGDNNEKNKALAIQGWEQAKRWISVGCYDMLILDEFTYTFSLGYLDVRQISLWLGDHKGKKSFPHLVISGRNCPNEILDIADIVSEIKEIKHPYRQNGRKPLSMIEY